jgi:hypothetical protein
MLTPELMILKLTTLAWKFTLLDPIEQGKMLVEIADLFQCPEGNGDLLLPCGP